LGCAGPVLR